jgi:hypothetical protein
MKRSMTVFLAAFGLVVLAGRSLEAQDLQQKVAAAKQAAAENKQALMQYSWIEQTQISYKGEVKNTKVDSCQYGPDGQVQKTPLDTEPAPQSDDSGGRRHRRHRVKEHIVEKKTGEMKDEMEAAGNLVKQYLPPDPEKIQAAKAAGKITITPGAGTDALTIADYEKSGDSLVLTLDAAQKVISKIDVNTWLDSPDQTVTLDVQMDSLPDGTHYPGTILLSVPSSHVDVEITNSNYEKLTP